MNVRELIDRLERLDESVVPRFVLAQDREFVTYHIDSMTDEGTLVVVSDGKMDFQ